MTQQIIDVGAAPNDGEGDPIRTAFQKVNNNFSQLFTTSSNAIASGSTNISIPLSSGNANVTVGNVANIAIFTTTGIVVANLRTAGNVTGANIISNGLVSANTIATTGNANIGGNVNVTGNMNVSGNITYNDIQSLNISDPLIYIGANNTTNLVDLGMIGSFDDGTYQHTGIVRDFTDGTWKFFSNVVAEPTTVVDWANAVYDPVLTGPLTSSSITANLITSNGNISATGNIVANNVNATKFYGNGVGLTNIVAANITGTVANATYASQALIANTVTTNAQPNVTSVGTLTSLSSTGNITGGNLVTTNYVFTTGGIYTDGYFYANGTPLAVSSLTYGNANVEAYLPTSNTIIGINSNVSNVASNVTTLQGQVYANANVAAYLPTYTGNLAALTGNVTTTANISGQYILGNGALLTGIVASSSYGNSNVAAYLPTYSGNIANLTVTGNLVATTQGNSDSSTLVATTEFVQNVVTAAGGYGNAQVAVYLPTYTGNLVSLTGPVTTTANVTGANIVTGGTLSSTGNVIAGNVNTTGVVSTTGNVNTLNVNATGVLSTTGNVQAGNVRTGGVISSTGNVIAGNFVTSGGVFLNTATGGQSELTLSDGVGSGYIVEVGTGAATWAGAGSLNLITSSAPGANIGIYVAQNETALFTLTGANITGQLNVTGNVDSDGITTGNITAGNLSVGNGTVTLNNIVNGGGNASGNIGSSSNYFNMVFAKATSAQYADLAEVYIGDTTYAPGTVLCFGGEREVTQSTVDMDVTVAGVVSTNPAYIMNTSAVDPNMVVVALTGRVPCFVTGPVTKGAMMVSNGDGTARAEKNPVMGSVIGKALESFTGTTGTIEIVVGRL